MTTRRRTSGSRRFQNRNRNEQRGVQSHRGRTYRGNIPDEENYERGRREFENEFEGNIRSGSGYNRDEEYNRGYSGRTNPDYENNEGFYDEENDEYAYAGESHGYRRPLGSRFSSERDAYENRNESRGGYGYEDDDERSTYRNQGRDWDSEDERGSGYGHQNYGSFENERRSGYERGSQRYGSSRGWDTLDPRRHGSSGSESFGGRYSGRDRNISSERREHGHSRSGHYGSRRRSRRHY